MLNLTGQEYRLCDGLTRRDALKIGVDMLQEGDEYVLARRLREELGG